MERVGSITSDTCYRRKAAITRCLNWGQVDFTMYNETFTGRASAQCPSQHHTSSSCPIAPEPSPICQPPTMKSTRAPTEICRLFNTKQGDKCRYNPCRFAHVCLDCQGRHPSALCPWEKPPPAKVSKPDSSLAQYR